MRIDRSERPVSLLGRASQQFIWLIRTMRDLDADLGLSLDIYAANGTTGTRVMRLARVSA
jgi:hypothetical protein